jgi:hypothetical protein
MRRWKQGCRRIAAVVFGGVALALTVAGAAVAGSGSGHFTTTQSALAQAQKATAEYRQLSVAKADGYGLLKDAKGIACIAMDGMPQMGAMGIHYANGKFVGDGKVAVTTPDALVYEPQADGSRKLVALEYVVFKSAWAKSHSSPPSLFGQTFNFTPKGNRFGLPAYYSLHVWIWKHNPSGTFSMWNPNVSCKA